MSGRPRFILELLIAATVGLLPLGFEALHNLASNVETEPHLLSRTIFVLRGVSYPGIIVGSLLVGALDGYGLVQHGWKDVPGNEGHPISWRKADMLRARSGVAANMAVFAALWFMLRTGKQASRRRKIAKVIIAVWLVAMTSLYVLGSLFTVYGP